MKKISNKKINNKQILIFGGSGFLGKVMGKIYKEKTPDPKIFCPSRSEVDINNFKSVNNVIIKFKPDVIINCAAIIGPEMCEKNQSLAYSVNSIGPQNIARAIKSFGLMNSVFVHISTSEVFGNDRELFDEKSITNTLNTYGRTKMLGEQNIINELRDSSINYSIIRTSWLYGKEKKTFVDIVAEALILQKQIEVICDQYNFPIWINNFAEAVLDFTFKKNHISGIFHYSSVPAEKISKYDIALYIAEILDCDSRLLKKAKKQSIFQVKRPNSAVLAHSSNIFSPKNWREGLKKYLKDNYVIEEKLGFRLKP